MIAPTPCPPEDRQMGIDITAAAKAIRTTMIGAIAAFESTFADFIGSEDWQEARAAALKVGNDQIRIIKLNAYDQQRT